MSLLVTPSQPIDGDLTAIAEIAGTSGLLKKTAADTWTLDTTAYLSAEVDTLATVTGRGSTTSTSITATSFVIPTNTTDAVIIKDDDLTAWEYTGKSFAVGDQETAPSGLYFSPDGTRMYVIGSTGDDVTQYSLSLAWDVTTATFVRVSAVIGETAPTGVFFKPDGTVMYVTGSTNDTVREFSLSVAWDVSTITFVRDFNITAQDTVPQDIWFRADGLKMYMVGSTNDRVYEYNLGTAWNISTLSFVQFFSVAAQEITPVSIDFASDGTRMYVLGATGLDINRYNLTTAWDISTAVYYNNFYIGFQETSASGMFIDRSNGVAYVVGSSADTVFQYATETDGIELVSSSGLFINGSLYTNKNLVVTSDSRIDGQLRLSGAATLSSTLAVSSTTTMAGAVTASTTTGAINLGTSQTTGAFIIGGTTQTGSITVGRSTGAQTLDFGTGATTTGVTKTINIGTAGASGSTTNINIGPTAGAGNTNVFGNVALGTNLANYLTIAGASTANAVSITTAGSDTDIGLNIATKGTGTITIDSGTGAGFIDLKPGADSLRLWDNNSSHYFSFSTGDIAANYTVTMPAVTGTFAMIHGTANTAGYFDASATTPTGTTRLNYSGYFYPTFINLLGSGDTATAATHYFVETGTDGFVRPKTLANVKTELVTSAAVVSGLGFTPYNATNPSSYIALASPITGYVAGTNTALSDTDTLNAALGKLQGQVTARTSNTGTVTSVGGTGTVNGLTLTGTVTTSGNLTLGGTLSLTSDIVDAVTTTTSTVSTTVKRDASGDVNVRLVRSEYANQATISGAIAFRVNNSTDNYVRFCSDAAAIRTFIGAGTSSTVGTVTSFAFTNGNGITGTVATSTTTPTLSFALGAVTGTSFNGVTGLASVAALAPGNAATGTSTLSARQDHVHPSTTAANLGINNASPTLYFQDTDQNSAMLHNNSNLFYLLRGGNNTQTWTQVGGYWPVYWDLTNNNATFGGAIWAAGNVTAYSDIKLKENIETVDGALSKVIQLRGVYYTLKRDESKVRKVGVIAQEIQRVLPEVVLLHKDNEDTEGTLSVDYGNITAVLIEAIKEQQVIIDSQEERLARLEAHINKQ
jgi:sugar lactone lactonase YvrE